jgi:hypothetical protein
MNVPICVVAASSNAAPACTPEDQWEEAARDAEMQAHHRSRQPQASRHPACTGADTEIRTWISN